jgi:NADH:ubiquinone oxidoreductase subunit F (NADH-binding)
VVEEVERAGWFDRVAVRVVEGPDAYLFGEETALLEVLDGRPPFPRINPPYRRGVTEVVAGDDDVTAGSGLPADVVMATEAGDNLAPPALVDNVETLANVPAIIARGAAWFRSAGTAASAGTVVCTVSGPGRRTRVVEVPCGTPLVDVLAAGTETDA